MSADRKAITPEVVHRVAELARLLVPPDERAAWADQLSRIVSYIDQIARIPEEAFERPPEPAPTPLRADEATAGEGREALDRNAPRLFEGFGVVPRVVGSGQ
jgi:aspartyl/glutamyl-tRNA(Asn/Gln) amidotransferase C subunit